MSFLGMNTEQVSEQAERCDAGQQRMVDLMHRLDGTVARSGEFWIGADADSFRDRWTWTSSELRSVGDELGFSRDDLRQHLDEQDAASDGGDAGAGGPSAHDGGEAADDPVPKTNAPGQDPYYGEVDPEVAEEWESMGTRERELVAREIIEEELERYGLDDVPIDFDLGDGNGLWTFSGDDGHTISINGSELSNPRLLHTLAHEARHAAQWEAVQSTEPDDSFFGGIGRTFQYMYLEKEHGFTREEIDSWRDHWDAEEHEKDPYLDQSVEIDARNAGAEFSDDLTLDDLERYKEEAGVN